MGKVDGKVVAGIGIIAAAGLGILAAAVANDQDMKDAIKSIFKGEHRQGSPHGHSHGGHSHGGHGHSHGHISFEDAKDWAERFEGPDRDGWQKPDEIVRLLYSLLDEARSAPSAAAASPAVIADIGAGTGYFASRIARAAAAQEGSGHIRVLASDSSAGMREYLIDRSARENLNLLVCTPPAPSCSAAPDSAGFSAGGAGLPLKADVALMVAMYHHLGNPTPDNQMQPSQIDARTAYLSAMKEKDLSPGGFVVVIEHRTGALPAHVPSPPAWMRLERSAILAEFEAAGYELHSAPDILEFHNVLVFRAA